MSKQLNILAYRGIIISRAAVHYRRLPIHLKASIDFSDFVQEGLCFAIGVLKKRLKKQLDLQRGSLSTIVYVSVDNFYKGLIDQLTCKKRGAETVSLDVVAERVAEDLAMDVLAAEKNVLRLHQMASYSLMSFLDDHFFSIRSIKTQTKSQKFKDIRSEFQSLAKRTGVTIDQYRLAISMHHARRPRPRDRSDFRRR